MYGKLFSSMYDGTLATRGPWEALVTFQQLVILADRRGHVDMTTEAIFRRTTIPIEVIRVGIAALEKPDPESRTPNEEGRRIVRLSDTRPWGWRIVNHDHYRRIRSQDERREYMRQYQRQRRAVNQNVNKSTEITKHSKQDAECNTHHTDAVRGGRLDDLVFPESISPQERDGFAALLGDTPHPQAVLDELTGAMARRRISNPPGYVRKLVELDREGAFVPEVGPAVAEARTRARGLQAELARRDAADQARTTAIPSRLPGEPLNTYIKRAWPGDVVKPE
jgi:hypothetical protein